MTPLVSILTPSYNQARYLTDCLRSVAAQTYPSIEHVVRDGGSTDGSADILRDAGSRVHWTSEPDGGQSDALNRAYAASSGEIIGWLNSDDGYADRRAVEWAVGYFARHSEVDVLYGETLLVNEENVVQQVRGALPFSLWLLGAVHYVSQPSLFFRRTAIERLDTFVRPDLHFVMDRDLILRLGATANVMPLRRVISFDREQRERKGFHPAQIEESLAFNRGLRPKRPVAWALATGVKIWLRLAAGVTAARLPAILDPAVDFSFPPLQTRLVWQLAYRRKALPLGALPPP